MKQVKGYGKFAQNTEIFFTKYWKKFGGLAEIVGTFKCVWKMAPVGQIFCPFLAPK